MEVPGIGKGDSHWAAQGRNCQLPGGLAAQGVSLWQRKEGGGATNSVTRNTNSPQRGAETLTLVKTRLSGFCPASEQERGRRSRLVSVGSGR